MYQYFGQFVVAMVRDLAIRAIDNAIESGFGSSKLAEKLRLVFASAGVSAGADVTAEIVDATVVQFLLALDSSATLSEGLDDDIYIKSVTMIVNDEEVVMDMRGELCGWYQGSDGWAAEYSKERKGLRSDD